MKTYTFSEYKKMQEMSNLDRILGELKKNKKEYARLVFMLAVFMPKPCFAMNNDMGIGDVFYEILRMGLEFGKYACMLKGIINMTNEMLEGANLKEAFSEGMGYFIFYIVLNLYPKFFSMLKF